MKTNPPDYWYNFTQFGRCSLCKLMIVEDKLFHLIIITCELMRCACNGDGRIKIKIRHDKVKRFLEEYKIDVGQEGTNFTVKIKTEVLWREYNVR